MEDVKKISFSVEGILGEEKITPSNITLTILSEFTEQISKFIRGKGYQNLNEIKTSIKEGSLQIFLDNHEGELNSAFQDYSKVLKSQSLNDIDPVRAKIIEDWQDIAHRTNERKYTISLSDDDDNILSDIMISGETNFESRKEIWVDVEVSLYGKVYDMGGKNKSNVHIELENGSTIKVGSDTSIIANVKENKLYKNQLLRIRAKRNINTGTLKDEQLISFEKYNPHFNQEEFDSISKKVTKAWSNVSNSSSWVEEIRGNYV